MNLTGRNVIAGSATRQLEFGKRLLLSALAIAAGPVAMGLLHVPRGQAQMQPPVAAPLSFDVASVKALTQPWIETSPKRSGGRFTWTTDLGYLIGYAYRMQPFRISGPIPASDSEFVYRVDATTAPAATDDQVRLMLQSLLVDRFKMVAHRVTKDVEGYSLSIGKGGLKIQEARAEDQPAPLPEWWRKGSVDPAAVEGRVVAHGVEAGVVAITGRRVSMLQFCEALQRLLDKPVWDDTGLNGKYYFAFRYAQDDAPADADASPLSAAVQQDLGLKIEKHKGPMEMLVVDSIEKKPTEN
jgi:uncharacterized protein (TIGR03435 family)